MDQNPYKSSQVQHQIDNHAGLWADCDLCYVPEKKHYFQMDKDGKLHSMDDVIDNAAIALANNYDPVEYQYHVHMKHDAIKYNHYCNVCVDQGPPSAEHKCWTCTKNPPVAQSVEAPASNTVESEFESQQEDNTVEGICPGCGKEGLMLRQRMVLADYADIHGIKNEDGNIIFLVSDPHDEEYEQILGSELTCAFCGYNTQLKGEVYFERI